MKKMIVLMLLAVSTVSFAETMPWTDLELNESYVLNHDIIFPEGIEFKAGEKVEVTDYMTLGIPVVYWQLHAENCKNPEATAEMILVNPSPEDTTTDRSIAVALTEGCNMDVWVEIRDLGTNSILDSGTEVK